MTQIQPKLYTNLTLAIPEEEYEMAYAALMDFPFVGIEEKMDEMVVCFLKEDWTDEKRVELLELFKNYNVNGEIISEDEVVEENWNEQWEKTIEPIVINERIVITPEWRQHDVSHPIKLIINPKMSFGTGYHPTTRMVCKLIEPLVKPNSLWIDAGTGTGILAILAAKLGANNILAFDNDMWSVENSIENVEMNGVAEKIDVQQADVFTIELPEVHGIAANLYRNLLIPSFKKFYNSLLKNNGDLVVSGVLKYDVDEIIEAALKDGFTHVHTEREDEWAAIHFKA
jgi:ribosomal protein L11 methyltransferase